MQQKLTLYWNIISQPARAVKSLIDIGKIPCNLTVINLFRLEQKKPNYLAINPMGTVPTLVDKGVTINQSIAILVYLCQMYPQNIASYYGTTIQEKAIVNQYLSWCQSYLRPRTGGLFLLQKQIGLRRRKPLPQQDVLIAKSQIKEGLQTLDRLIGDKNYLANNRVSIADLMVYFEITILVYYGLDHYEYKNIDRWFKKIYAIPEVKTLTHQWFPIAQQMYKALKQLPIKNAAL